MDREFDENEFLAAFEAEFDELRRDVDRITAMTVAPATDPAPLVTALRALREDLEQKARARVDPTGAQERLDRALLDALDKILKEGMVTGTDGNVAFRLDTTKMKEHAGAVLHELLDVVKANLWSTLGTRVLAAAAPNLAPALGMSPDEPAREPDPQKPHKELTGLDFAVVLGSIFMPRPEKDKDKKKDK